MIWTSSQEALGTPLNFSTTCHPEIDRMNRGTNQILEYYVTYVCVVPIETLGIVLAFAEFLCNNNHQGIVKMAPLSFSMGDCVRCL
jgi:hypothetical protein